MIEAVSSTLIIQQEGRENFLNEEKNIMKILTSLTSIQTKILILTGYVYLYIMNAQWQCYKADCNSTECPFTFNVRCHWQVISNERLMIPFKDPYYSWSHTKKNSDSVKTALLSCMINCETTGSSVTLIPMLQLLKGRARNVFDYYSELS